MASLPISEETFLETLKDVGAPHLPLEDAVTEHLESTPPVSAVTTTTVPLPLAAVTKQNIWGHPEAHPVVLQALLRGAFGDDWLEWEAETFAPRIAEEFLGVGLSALNLSKVQAVRTLLLSDAFWERWEIFLACCMPFNGEFPDFVMMQVPSVGQVLIACSTAGHVRTEAVPAWSEELKAYIKTVYEHDGLYQTLPPANFVTPDVPEGLDIKAVRDRCDEVLRAGKPLPATTPVAVQLDRLLVAQHQLNENREQLMNQLGLFHAR